MHSGTIAECAVELGRLHGETALSRRSASSSTRMQTHRRTPAKASATFALQLQVLSPSGYAGTAQPRSWI